MHLASLGAVSFVQANVSSLILSPNKKKVAGVVANRMEIHAPIVINSAGALPTYELLSPHMDVSSQITSLKSTDEPSVAFIFLFVALDVTSQPESERDDSSHNRWIYPQGNHTQFEKDVDSTKPWELPARLFVASGSSKDGGWEERHKGKKTVVVLAACPWGWVSEWKDLSKKEREANKEYQAFKELTRETLYNQGFLRVYPHLAKYVSFTDVGTPLTTNNFLAKAQGECYGRSAVPKHWACPELSPTTCCKGYYGSGQDFGTLGLAGSLAAGYTAANLAGGCVNVKNVLLGLELSNLAGEEAIYG